jgi:hypothetical protein
VTQRNRWPLFKAALHITWPTVRMRPAHAHVHGMSLRLSLVNYLRRAPAASCSIFRYIGINALWYVCVDPLMKVINNVILIKKPYSKKKSAR